MIRRGDVGGFAEAVTRLLDDPEERRLLADEGYAEFIRRYDIESVADQTAQLYRAIAGGNP